MEETSNVYKWDWLLYFYTRNPPEQAAIAEAFGKIYGAPAVI